MPACCIQKVTSLDLELNNLKAVSCTVSVIMSALILFLSNPHTQAKETASQEVVAKTHQLEEVNGLKVYLFNQST